MTFEKVGDILKRIRSCEQCGLPLTRYKGESTPSYLKKRFHKPCKDVWMKENKMGFYQSLWPKKE